MSLMYEFFSYTNKREKNLLHSFDTTFNLEGETSITKQLQLE